jgi:hypothetical protein
MHEEIYAEILNKIYAKICRKSAENLQNYAWTQPVWILRENMQNFAKICKNMQKYAST